MIIILKSKAAQYLVCWDSQPPRLWWCLRSQSHWSVAGRCRWVWTAACPVPAACLQSPRWLCKRYTDTQLLTHQLYWHILPQPSLWLAGESLNSFIQIDKKVMKMWCFLLSKHIKPEDFTTMVLKPYQTSVYHTSSPGFNIWQWFCWFARDIRHTAKLSETKSLCYPNIKPVACKTKSGVRHYPSFQWGLRCFFMSSTTPSNHCQKVKLRPGKLSCINQICSISMLKGTRETRWAWEFRLITPCIKSTAGTWLP